MVKNGFYIVKDDFFQQMQDEFLKNNKDGNRPFYYCINDLKRSDLFWMIPMSSRVDKYKSMMQKRASLNKSNDGLHICKLPNGNKSVFLIQDIFPITEKYIEREYTLGGNHLILPYEDDVVQIEKKARKIRNLILRGIILTPTSPNIPRIMELL